MLKTIIAAMLATIAFSASATDMVIKPDNVYNFEINDKLNSIEGNYSIAIDESILLECKNKEENKDNVAYNCKIDLKTVKDFDINNKNITGVQMFIIPLSIEKDMLKATIVYKQRIDETHSLNYHMVDHPLKLNEKNIIKLTDKNDLYISVKKEEY